MVERAAEHVDRAGELHTTHHHHHVDDVHDVDYRADHDHGGDPINHDSDINIYPDEFFDDVDQPPDDYPAELEHEFNLRRAGYEHVGTYNLDSDLGQHAYDIVTGELPTEQHRSIFFTFQHRHPWVVVHRRCDRR